MIKLVYSYIFFDSLASSAVLTPQFICLCRSLSPFWFSWPSWTIFPAFKCQKGYNETNKEVESKGMLKFSALLSWPRAMAWLRLFKHFISVENKNLNASSFLQLTAVHLVDAHLCSDPGKYISALLLSLSTMLHLELPHVNVLSKIDLIESYGKLGSSTLSDHLDRMLVPCFPCSYI